MRLILAVTLLLGINMHSLGGSASIIDSAAPPRHVTTYAGRDDPQFVEYGGVLSVLTSLLGMDQLEPSDQIVDSVRSLLQIPREDAAILVARLYQTRKELGSNAEMESTLRQLCGEYIDPAGPVDLALVGRELTRITAESNAQAKSRYDTLVGSLSTVGQNALNEFVSRRIISNVTVVIVDYESFLVEYPAYSSKIMELCSESTTVNR